MRVTDAERLDNLYELASEALVNKAARQYQIPWSDAVLGGVMSWPEERYAAAASPALIRRTIRRLRRLSGEPV